MELFAGSGNLSAAIKALGIQDLAVDLKYGGAFDLTRRATQLEIQSWFRQGLVVAAHLAPPCTVWSIARRGVRNLEKARAKETLNLGLALFCVEVCREASRCGAPWSLEQPRTSRMWDFAPIAGLGSLPRLRYVDLDFCEVRSLHKNLPG